MVFDATLRRRRPDLGEYAVQHCSRQRPATYVRATGNRRRWEIAVLPGDDDAAITQPAKVLELLKLWVLEGGAPIRMTSIQPRLGPGVAAGWNGLAGQIAPQPLLADGTRLDDRVGYRFAALMRPDLAADLAGLLRPC